MQNFNLNYQLQDDLSPSEILILTAFPLPHTELQNPQFLCLWEADFSWSRTTCLVIFLVYVSNGYQSFPLQGMGFNWYACFHMNSQKRMENNDKSKLKSNKSGLKQLEAFLTIKVTAEISKQVDSEICSSISQSHEL